ncbi:MAG: DNA polymerase I [Ruminococcaceae bacterium]|nr:DNA polymerase I [Oscillospiraceae bacterium]
MRLLALDANSIANRAYYGVRPLTTKDGQYTNALYGFLHIFARLKEQAAPDAIVAAFDRHAPTFRHKMYDGYKAGRKGMPEELRSQMPILKELLPLLGCHIVELDGFEADDILGTLAAACRRDGHTCVIATGDRDSLQLVGDGVEVWLSTTKMGQPETVVMDTAAVENKYGLSPARLIDLKALMGDSSDNIPGVAGVGEKTAVGLLQQFGTLDNLYASLDTADMRDSLRQKLAAGKDSAYLSRTLGTICCEVPIETDIAAYRAGEWQKAPLAALLTRLEFFKMIEKWGLADIPVAASVDNAVPALVAASCADVLGGEGGVAAVPEADGVWLVRDGKAAFFAFDSADFAAAADILCDSTVDKQVHDGKPLFARLLKMGRTPAGFSMDTALAAYLLNPLSSDYSLPRLIQEYGVAAAEAADLPAFLSAFGVLAKTLGDAVDEQGQGALLREMELPLSVVLADMENVGFLVDADGIAAYGDKLAAEIAALEAGIFEAVGYAFNLNSPKQLGKALFEDLGLPAKKKTKSGYSTNAEVLEGLRAAHPAVDMLLTYRTLAKLKSTYCDGLLKVIDTDGRVRSSFNQTETRTGRISSTEPNLQNIPVRTAVGRELRRFFHAREGYLLIDADYSQIELRVLAHMAQDKTMLDAFNTGVDIHRVTASQVFGVAPDEVTSQMRSHAKAVNFGIIYGIGPHSLSQDIGVSFGQAKQYIADYLRHYASVDRFMQGLIDSAKESGYAKTLLGRRRPLPELRTGNAITRGFGERVARNMPIQGTAADIIKAAMVAVWRGLRERFPDARLLLTVHDELIVEAPESQADEVAVFVAAAMANAAQLSVRLDTDVHVGKTWFDTKE